MPHAVIAHLGQVQPRGGGRGVDDGVGGVLDPAGQQRVAGHGRGQAADLGGAAGRPGVDHGRRVSTVGAHVVDDDAGPAAQGVRAVRPGLQGHGQVRPVDEVGGVLVPPLDEVVDTH